MFSSELLLCTTTVEEHLCLLLCLLFMWGFKLRTLENSRLELMWWKKQAYHILTSHILQDPFIKPFNRHYIATSLWLMIVHGDCKIRFILNTKNRGSSLRWKIVCCCTVSSWHASFMLDFVLQSSLFSYSIIEGLPLFPYVEHIWHPCA